MAVDVMRKGDYAIVREEIMGDMDYLATHGGKLLTVACDGATAMRRCEDHALTAGREPVVDEQGRGE